MQKHEIIESAIHIYYPKGYPIDKQCVEDGKKIYQLPIIDMRYNGMDRNSHHFTTYYHYNYVLPFYNNILKFGFDINDFIKNENIIIQGDKNFDLSYLTPIIDKNFEVNGIGFDCHYICNYNGLMYNENVKDITWVTPYHELYCLPHLSSCVTNLSKNNGKNLLLIGDSQSIPDIPILSYYFKNICYIDNRDKLMILDKIKDKHFDNVIFAQNTNDNEYYYNFLK